MVKIVPLTIIDNEVHLGNVCKFRLKKSDPDIETRSFIQLHNIFYLKPLTNWNTQGELYFFPESPGKYNLYVQWRNSEGLSGRVHYEFKVKEYVETYFIPKLVIIDKETRFWCPSEWDAKLIQNYEKPVFDLLSSIIKPDQVVYDIGANIGQFALRFSRLVGKQGHVYCIEINPLCIYFLQTNIELNHATNCEILPIAITDVSKSIELTINYGNSALGIVNDSPFYLSKIGHEVNIYGNSLDELLDKYDLVKPDIVKIDIEGAEGYAISGMGKILEKYRPVLIIEVHGQKAAHFTFPKLNRFGYEFKDINSGNTFSNVRELVEWFPEAVLQFLCTPIR